MILKSAHFLAFAVAGAVLFPPASFIAAQADPVEILRCNSSQCEFAKEIGASSMKEYRAVCTNADKPYPKKLSVKQENNNTSCTEKCRGPGSSSYLSRSCANESLSRDKLKIVIRCGEIPRDRGDPGDRCR